MLRRSFKFQRIRIRELSSRQPARDDADMTLVAGEEKDRRAACDDDD